ncbi:GNAT family N-acetyltransferase [Modestobacter sp. I12A-02628]|uniref:GNAT family N-acetyltransferase n=1 Tax=Goekera deserti TaxID=2497753 RepID=A0A7K3WE08_9ACTN|nr:GNAT family N-acetyltransferase [Goekera deserti]MPQ99640.1 GNAT family N-acetyltransferase [Goekera deserti]NDI46350.1 GNAT family N-acetyltransferase [Goekera deserti]NEL54718.1 GNAT family N-acetyltransferase [Goekera deserti]
MLTLTLAHTADLDVAALRAVRALLDDVFDGAFGDDDWDHARGGVHVLLTGDNGLVTGDDGLVGHAAVVARRLLHAGRALRTGYVEGVAVHRSHRRRGHGGTLMAAAERVVRGGYDLGALSASAEALAFYRGRGWLPWTGPASALTPDGVRPTPDEDSLHVLPVGVPVDPAGELTCDWRDGDLW